MQCRALAAKAAQNAPAHAPAPEVFSEVVLPAPLAVDDYRPAVHGSVLGFAERRFKPGGVFIPLLVGPFLVDLAENAPFIPAPAPAAGNEPLGPLQPEVLHPGQKDTLPASLGFPGEVKAFGRAKVKGSQNEHGQPVHPAPALLQGRGAVEALEGAPPVGPAQRRRPAAHGATQVLLQRKGPLAGAAEKLNQAAAGEASDQALPLALAHQQLVSGAAEPPATALAAKLAPAEVAVGQGSGSYLAAQPRPQGHAGLPAQPAQPLAQRGAVAQNEGLQCVVQLLLVDVLEIGQGVNVDAPGVVPQPVLPKGGCGGIIGAVPEKAPSGESAEVRGQKKVRRVLLVEFGGGAFSTGGLGAFAARLLPEEVFVAAAIIVGVLAQPVVAVVAQPSAGVAAQAQPAVAPGFPSARVAAQLGQAVEGVTMDLKVAPAGVAVPQSPGLAQRGAKAKGANATEGGGAAASR